MARGKKYVSSKVTILPKEEQPFSVPENWFWTDIDSINQYSGSPVDPMKQPDTVFELYSVPSSADDYPEILAGSEIGSSKQSVIKNDILLCKINPRINRVWKVSQHTDNKLMASSEWIVVRNSVINSDYLMFCFRTQFFREFMLSNVSGVGGSLMRAQPKYVKKYPVPIAPIDEQHRIVSRIESLFAKLDEAKEKAQAVVDGFELRKSAILHKAFTGELTERWRSKRGADKWRTSTFGKYTNSQYGYTESATQEPVGPKFLRITDIQDGVVNWDKVPYCAISKDDFEKYSMKQGDIVIARTGATTGKSYLIADDVKAVFASYLIRLTMKQAGLMTRYLYYFMQSPSYWQQITEFSAGIAQPGVNAKKLQKIELPIPSVEEQEEVVVALDKILKKEQQAKEAAEAVLAQIDTMKKAILARAFRGELGTNDPAEEWAGEMVKEIL